MSLKDVIPVFEPIDQNQLLITEDELAQAFFSEKVPVPFKTIKEIVEKIASTVTDGGYYTVLYKTESAGCLFTFHDKEGNLIDAINISKPVISKDRKIPTRNWLAELFVAGGVTRESLDFKYIYRIIESHIRDGGTWEPAVGPSYLIITLRMNDHVKARYEFHRGPESNV